MAERPKARYFLFGLWVFLCTELLGQLGLHALRGYVTWERPAYQSQFNVRPFTRLVADNRVATPIPGYRSDLLVDDAHPGRGRWRLEIDENGFRGRKENYEGKPQVIAFIGDSVPFGWGVAAGASVPSQFQTLLRGQWLIEVGVLNGAVPSYTLSQAVERFHLEIAGRYPLTSVIVQTYDPVTQFSLLGERWNARISWATRNGEPARPLLGPLEKYLDYSLFLNVGLRVFYHFRNKSGDLGLPALTEAAWEKFDKENDATLSELMEAARPRHASLILLPVNPAPDRGLEYSVREQDIIDHFNRFLSTFASRHPGAYFFDVRATFVSHPHPDRLFIDTCCHLSEEGAGLQAQYLLQKFQQNGLLALK